MAKAPTLKDEIRFRCERDLKPRLKRVVKAKYGAFAKYQAVARDVVREFVDQAESEEQAKLAEAPKPEGVCA